MTILAAAPADVDWGPMAAETRLTMGQAKRLAEEVQQAKAQLLDIEKAIAPLRCSIVALERRLERREGPR